MKRSAYKFLGLQVNALSLFELNSLVAEAIGRNEKWIIANHNLHSLYLYHHDPQMRAFYAEAKYTHIDGMPIVFLGKFLGYPLRRSQRVTYVDWVWSLIGEAAQGNWRVFYLGSQPGVAEAGAQILRDRFPGLQIATAHGYIDIHTESQENQAVLAAMGAFQPHILMVGMGMPRQERWILDNLSHIPANVILPSGACIDYVAGAVPTPPRWMGKLGLEWLYRLGAEPQRLWRRYLLEPWFIVKLLARELWTTRKGHQRQV